MTTLPSHVQELAEQVTAAHGSGVLELRLLRQGRARVLRVVLDTDGPVEADTVERISKDLSRALDETDPLPGSYTLEVTTPGLDRPLHSARDFRRQRGHEVEIVQAVPGAAAVRVRGVVAAVQDEAVTLAADGGEVSVPLSQVVRGKVVLPW